MTLLLDTSILIDLERRWEPTLIKLRELSLLHPLPATITFMNWFEFELGIKERAVRNQEKALQFLSSFSVLNTTVKTASILAELKQLRSTRDQPFLGRLANSQPGPGK